MVCGWRCAQAWGDGRAEIEIWCAAHVCMRVRVYAQPCACVSVSVSVKEGVLARACDFEGGFFLPRLSVQGMRALSGLSSKSLPVCKNRDSHKKHRRVNQYFSLG